MYDFIQIDAARFRGCVRCSLPSVLGRVNGFNVLPGVTITNSSALTKKDKDYISAQLKLRGKQVKFE